ncbi:MAG: hypothetical protein COS11_05460 [bacterium (Candidatus Ratteibacteria) CG01_land_8_20_14_3_00_40_19]|uniref:Uncharacterized protein n=1 Tax=bacterium (Candidatus Ratteibacteria) CG01_land_8_20_14_3_00_40_19 TaxID=2014290 RepID=A0A2M7E7X2_9BACT|nr:MAG: hypothetical protein COS11_05460 [bacterium (Candidatus Ratteibacteria) CG01_land_8_20_14_3_00_40_19]
MQSPIFSENNQKKPVNKIRVGIIRCDLYCHCGKTLSKAAASIHKGNFRIVTGIQRLFYYLLTLRNLRHFPAGKI